MKKENRRTTAQEISSKLTKENFFLETNVNGVVSATPFLDHYDPMKAGKTKVFKKHAQMWQYLKEGWPIKGSLEQIADQKSGALYVWLEFEFPRGIFENRFDILGPQLLEFIQKYQKGAVSFYSTLPELMEEANRIESVSDTGFQAPNKFPYQSEEFSSSDDKKEDETISKLGAED